MALKKPVKFGGLVILGLGLSFGLRYVKENYIPKKPEVIAEVPRTAVLPAAPTSAPASSAPAVAPSMVPRPANLPSLPTAKSGGKSGTIRHLLWAWNAQSGELLANGGSVTKPGSLMAYHGASLQLMRQDDVSIMQAELVKCASELAGGATDCENGAHFVSIMGDGAAAFFAGVNPQLEKFGREYRAEIVGSAGYSRGEDKFMGLPAWKKNPQSARGALVAGYLRDGDWNIALKWAGDNGICNNPDETTYDPNCINWMAADTYIHASKLYIAGHCEDRPVVSQGRRTGEMEHVCVDGVVTWTPGDVMVADQRGGLVSIVSTKEYDSQMANVIIGIRKWNQSHRSQVESFLEAIFAGGDEIKRSDSNLKKACAISAEVYNEETAEYWCTYFKGVTRKDKQGLDVELGGSSVNNLADNMLLFGLEDGAFNVYAAVYKVFGDIVVQQYPLLVPSYPPVSDVLDTSYVANIASRTQKEQMIPAEKPVFVAEAPVRQVVSTKAWKINFATGKAVFTPEAEATLQALLDQLLVAGSLAIEVHGHTDNTGSKSVNDQLSEDRAFAVKHWLEAKAPANFPTGRVRVFAHGPSVPVASNGTEAGRAENRRVVIVLGAQ